MNSKELILNEAKKVFEKFGFNKTSMADIAWAARMGRRTIYTYFTGKEDVFKAVIEIEVKALADKLTEIIAQPISPNEKLRIYMHTRMNAIKELTIFYDALRQDLLNNLGLIENLRKEYDAMEVEVIKMILDEGVTKNVFSIEDTRMVAGAIVMATKGFELPMYMGQADYDHNKFIDPLINLFYNGILSIESRVR